MTNLQELRDLLTVTCQEQDHQWDHPGIEFSEGLDSRLPAIARMFEIFEEGTVPFLRMTGDRDEPAFTGDYLHLRYGPRDLKLFAFIKVAKCSSNVRAAHEKHAADEPEEEEIPNPNSPSGTLLDWVVKVAYGSEIGTVETVSRLKAAIERFLLLEEEEARALEKIFAKMCSATE